MRDAHKMTKSGMILVILSYAQPMISPNRRSGSYLCGSISVGNLPKIR